MAELLTVSEILNKIGIARATLYRMIDEGLPYKQVGLRKKLFDPDEVMEFIGKRKNDLVSKLEIDNEYLNEEICTIFKCSTQGGMRRSHSTGALVLTSHHDDPNNAYVDYWQDDIFYYTGMGMEGDQALDYAQNKTLANSNNNGIVVYLFEVFSSRKYMYRGIVKLIGEPFLKDEIDFNGTLRKVWKFPLRLVNQSFLSETFISREQAYMVKAAKTLSDKELQKRAYLADGIARSRATKTITYEYNLDVREYAKRRARGICQLCRKPAPFMVNGKPYLKSYHLIPLSEHGLDIPKNVAALCPNCYEQILQLRNLQDIDRVRQHMEEDEKRY